MLGWFCRRASSTAQEAYDKELALDKQRYSKRQEQRKKKYLEKQAKIGHLREQLNAKQNTVQALMDANSCLLISNQPYYIPKFYSEKGVRNYLEQLLPLITSEVNEQIAQAVAGWADNQKQILALQEVLGDLNAELTILVHKCNDLSGRNHSYVHDVLIISPKEENVWLEFDRIATT